ncbi:hypothetical protein [Sphingobium sp. CFD-1]|uniref:hypothetical protein n=1 Tax=Sphingobium sp. CFD-1 TaxID=2878545 RepID=UPI00214C017F|nr:hypothetical protein [Sphingobium sp. CFD-1]
MVKISSGMKAHKARLKRIRGPEMVREIGKAIFVASDLLKVEAQISITTGAVSGRNHKPSAPGTPPNAATHHLSDSIENHKTGPLTAETTSNAEYAAIQEFGGTINHPGGTPYFMRDGKPVFVSKQGQGAFHNLPVTKPHQITLPERPYMRPAAQKTRPKARALVVEAVKRVTKGGTL